MTELAGSIRTAATPAPGGAKGYATVGSPEENATPELVRELEKHRFSADAIDQIEHQIARGDMSEAEVFKHLAKHEYSILKQADVPLMLYTGAGLGLGVFGGIATANIQAAKITKAAEAAGLPGVSASTVSRMRATHVGANLASVATVAGITAGSMLLYDKLRDSGMGDTTSGAITLGSVGVVSAGMLAAGTKLGGGKFTNIALDGASPARHIGAKVLTSPQGSLLPALAVAGTMFGVSKIDDLVDGAPGDLLAGAAGIGIGAGAIAAGRSLSATSATGSVAKAALMGVAMGGMLSGVLNVGQSLHTALGMHEKSGTMAGLGLATAAMGLPLIGQTKAVRAAGGSGRGPLIAALAAVSIGTLLFSAAAPNKGDR